MLIARSVSAFLNPAFMNFYFALLLFFIGSKEIRVYELSISMIQVGIVLLVTYIFPFLIYFIAGKRIRNYLLTTQISEKLFLILLVILANFAGIYILRLSSVPPVYQIFHLGSILLAGLSLIILLYYNLSIYMVGTGAFTGAVLGMYNFLPHLSLSLLYWVILFSGFTGYSRLILKKHTPAQVYLGFLLGAALMYFYFSLAVR